MSIYKLIQIGQPDQLIQVKLFIPVFLIFIQLVVSTIHDAIPPKAFVENVSPRRLFLLCNIPIVVFHRYSTITCLIG